MPISYFLQCTLNDDYCIPASIELKKVLKRIKPNGATVNTLGRR